MPNDDAWHMTLITLAAQDCIARRAAIRHLYFAGYEVEWIADACYIPVALVQDALNRIP